MKRTVRIAVLLLLIAMIGTAAFAQGNGGSASDNPAKQPVQFLLLADMAGGQGSRLNLNAFTVPASKRLVIETVSIEFSTPHNSGSRPFVRIRTTAGGTRLTHVLPLTFLAAWPAIDYWGGNHHLRLYNDPQQPVEFTVSRSPDANGSFPGNTQFWITVTGHYVDLP